MKKYEKNFIKNNVRCYLCLKDYLRFDTKCNQYSTIFGYWNLSTEKKPEQMLKPSFRMEANSHKPQELHFAWEIKSGYKERMACYRAADGL